MSATPPGWYDDGHGALRWWDGRVWTEHVATPDPAPEFEAEAASLQPDQPTMAYPPADQQATQVVEPVAPGAANPFAEGYVPAAADGATAAAPPYAAAWGGSPGYPGDYPGAYTGGTAGGAFMAATEPRKSRAWIVWVVVGAVLLGFVILAAVLIPLILFVSSATSSSSGSSGPAPSQSEAVEVQAATEDEAAAVATIELYNDSWIDADCGKYFATTTEAFRTDIDLVDCASFEEAAAAWGSSIDNYDVTVVAIESSTSSAITVRTSESYDSWYDEDGDPVVDPVPLADEWLYDVIARDGAWVIDGAY